MTNNKLYQDKEWLKEQIEIYKTGAEIARQFNYSPVTVQRYLKKYDLYLSQEEKISKDMLITKYKEGLSPKEIAKVFNKDVEYIWHLNNYYNVSYLDYKEKREYENKEWLQEQFNKYKTVTEVARQTNYPRTCITRYAKKFDIYTEKYTRNIRNTVNEDYFNMIDTEEKAYWLGFIMADGNMYIHENGKTQFSLKLQYKDHHHIEKFAQAINYDGTITVANRKRKETVCKYSEIKIYNKNFCNNLIKHGIVPNKTGKECLPNTIPENLVKHFFRGFIDGDGWLFGSLAKGKTAQIGLCSTCPDIINSFNEIYKDIFEIRIEHYNNIYRQLISKKRNVYEASSGCMK